MTQGLSAIDIRCLPPPSECVPGNAKEECEESTRKGDTPEGGAIKKATRSRNRLPGASKQLPEDGFHWLKYGHKNILGNTFSRAYYKCAQKGEGCGARKTVDFPIKDQSDLCITYDGKHNHAASNCPVDPCHVVVRHKGHDDSLSALGTPHARQSGYMAQDTDSHSSTHVLNGPGHLLAGSLPTWKVPPPPSGASSHETLPTHSANAHTHSPTDVPSLESSQEGSLAAHVLFTNAIRDQHALLPVPPRLPPLPYGLRQMTWGAHPSVALHGVPEGHPFFPWAHLYSGSGMPTPRAARAAEVQAADDHLSGSGSTESPPPGSLHGVIRPIASRPSGSLQAGQCPPDASAGGATEHADPSSSNCASLSDSTPAPDPARETSGALSMARVSRSRTTGVKHGARDWTHSADQRPAKRVLVSLASREERSDQHSSRPSMDPTGVPNPLGGSTLVPDAHKTCAVDLTLRL